MIHPPRLDALLREIQSATREQLESWLFEVRQQESADDQQTRVWALIRAGAYEAALDDNDDPVRYLAEIKSITEEFILGASDSLVEDAQTFLKDHHGPA